MNLKKYFSFMAVACFSFIALVSGTSAAADLVTEETGVSGEKMIFANGTDITIEAKAGETDANLTGAVIKWSQDGQEKTKEVDADAIIFGGSYSNTEADASEVESTSITMNGGKVASIYAGGYNYNTITGESIITVNGGVVANVYGGGTEHSVTTSSNIFVNGGAITVLTLAGDNGTVNNSAVQIMGGKVTTLQSVEEGTVDNVSMYIADNAEVTTAYLTSEAGTGSVESIEFAAVSGKVTTLEMGTTEPTVEVQVYARDGVVTNVATEVTDKTNVVPILKVTIKYGDDSLETIDVPKGWTLSEIFEMTLEEMKKENEDFQGIRVKGSDEFLKDDYVFENDVELEFVFAKSTTKNPNTGDNIIAYVVMALAGTCALGFATKKIFF